MLSDKKDEYWLRWGSNPEAKLYLLEATALTTAPKWQEEFWVIGEPYEQVMHGPHIWQKKISTDSGGIRTQKPNGTIRRPLL